MGSAAPKAEVQILTGGPEAIADVRESLRANRGSTDSLLASNEDALSLLSSTRMTTSDMLSFLSSGERCVTGVKKVHLTGLQMESELQTKGV